MSDEPTVEDGLRQVLMEVCAERDRLREALKEARVYVDDKALLKQIDAALNKEQRSTT